MNLSKPVKISKKNAIVFQEGVTRFFEDLIMIGAATSTEYTPERRRVISVVAKHGIISFTLLPTHSDSTVYTVFRRWILESASEGYNPKMNFHLVNRRGMKGKEAVQAFIADCKHFLLAGTCEKLIVVDKARSELKIKRKKKA